MVYKIPNGPWTFFTAATLAEQAWFLTNQDLVRFASHLLIGEPIELSVIVGTFVAAPWVASARILILIGFHRADLAAI